ncbi:hypothetical protein [Poseidonibacter ostreae]|uniref:Uncharacterized protein n=1 Tax=Poseidonibacter ostreae TaxID=2654171 RepID=A0A6L4WVE7_9BACT|nr:hypothetical protein [Poseidonibacter ostreae]KAB7881930.1 hypothetical protein GA417_14110 [Poseidonibacter ostreae]KAB7890327.1 hypothetical protein GBG19_03625 [Poseidonibacter ostreae]KAB7890557.1 hypothetical protein GBG18_08500 [Poseidonibacter ostreae]MAC85159.1 hypothetical protein [Arcobacter sp.]
MEPQYEEMIVLGIVLLAGFLTWKMVKDFYITKLHKVIAHLIAVTTASFMLLSTLFLFMPKDYQRTLDGTSSEVELSFMSVLTVLVMLAVLFVFFKYSPQGTKKK